MKIAYVVSTFPPRVGGMGSVCLAEAKLAKQAGHEPTVFTLCPPGQRAMEFSFPVVHLRGIPRLGDAGLTPQLFWKLRDFDLIHLHYPFYGGAEWVYLAHKIFGKKYVLTYHMDAEPTEIYKKIVQKIYDFIWPKFIFNKAEKIITVDAEHFVQSKFSASIKKDKIIEIINSVDLDVFRPNPLVTVSSDISINRAPSSEESSESLEILHSVQNNNKKIILFVGNLMPVKRLDILLRVMINLPDAVLLVAGGNYYEKKYRQMASDLGVSDRVKFLGTKNNLEDLVRYYNLADCVAIPSDTESFSLVAVEAMAVGRIVVGSDITALRGRIDNGVNGFLAEAGSVKDFFNKIKMILQLSAADKIRISQAARKKATDNYGWDKHWEKLQTVYAV